MMAPTSPFRPVLQYCLALLAINALFLLSGAHPTGSSTSPENTYPDKRQSKSRGIVIIPGKCAGDQLTAMQNAILDASYLAGAGLNAASSFTSLPFSYFFAGNQDTANTVAGVLQRVQQAQLGNGQLIGATCEDVYNRCGPLRSKANGNTLIGYSAQIKNSLRAPIIVFCPTAFLLPRNPVPCTADPGTQTLGGLMLHEMTHIYQISGPDLDIEDLTTDTARVINQAVTSGTDTTLDAVRTFRSDCFLIRPKSQSFGRSIYFGILPNATSLTGLTYPGHKE